MLTGNHTNILLTTSEGYEYPAAERGLLLHLRGNRVGKGAVERQGQDDVDKQNIRSIMRPKQTNP